MSLCKWVEGFVRTKGKMIFNFSIKKYHEPNLPTKLNQTKSKL